LSTLEDQLEQITSALDDLRANRAGGPETRKAIDSLFRRTHNLKAAAAADGLHDLSQAANELENLLHSLRTGAATLNDRMLQQLAEKSTAISESRPPVPAEIWNSLKAEERHSLSQAVNEGAELFLVQTSFEVVDFDQRFQKLKEILSSTGELISIAPKAENNTINFQILYAGDLSAQLSELANVTVSELRARETISLATVMQRAVRAGQSAALLLGKTIDFELHGEDVSLEESLCRVVADPLLHLVRNAVDHGIEHEGKITIQAARIPGEIRIRVTDDGRGIDPETIATGKLLEPGFSTASEVSEISGRGVGLDVVKTAVEEAGGSINVTSQLGRGTTFEFTLPSA
jgi:two-component system, chemotaxis family, sensor kinase CheA